ncbi:MAG: hypothetical protein IPM18_16010 [Phycisphaerales bacterium]|nr:hypothetical protein [Phycisphaerales bacterium]
MPVILRLTVPVAALALLVGAVRIQSADEPAPSSGTPPAATQPASTTQPGVGLLPVTLTDPASDLVSGLIGSKHDFSHGGRTGRDLCLPCHAPHLVSPPPPQLDARPTTTQPLRPYEGPGIVLNSWSMLCLGCHDGITAHDVYSGSHALATGDQLANSRLPATARTSHPIGITYPLAAPGYRTRAEVEAAGLLLPDGRIQCTTCHDAHNTHRHPGMLKISNSRSRMCLACHNI